MDNFNFGKNLKKIRLIKGISQAAMASRLEISQATYSRLEHQSDIPDADMVNRLAEILEVPSADLLGPSGELELQTTLSTDVVGLGQGSKLVINLRKPIRKFLILLAAYLIVNVVYTTAKGAASGFGASDKTMIIVGLSVALLCSIFIYYLIRKNKIW